MNYIINDLPNNLAQSSHENSNFTNDFTEIEFEFEDNHRSTLQTAQQYEIDTKKKLGLNLFRSNPIDPRIFKKFSINSDLFAQLVLHKTFLDTKNELPCSYQAASTAAFKHGRTENLRCLTPKMAGVVLALANNDQDENLNFSVDLKKLAELSVEHSDMVKYCVTGNFKKIP